LSDKSNNYFPALTGFRAIAAWLVFAHHYNPFDRERFGLLSDVVHEGYIGVSMFFVLSGFLITIRYDDPLLPKPTFGRYMRNRFARIYPLYFILTTLTFVVIGKLDWIYLTNITFIKGFFDELKFTGISQGWSLTVEETFYLLAPLIFILIRKIKFMWVLPFAFLAIGIAIYLPFNSLDFMLIYTFFGRAFDFFVGIWLAKNFQSQHSKSFFTWAGLCFILISLVSLALVRGNAAYGVSTLPGLFIHHLLVPASTALLLWGLLKERSILQRILSTPFMRLLGKSSYVFYLVHIGIIATWMSGIVSSNVLILFILLNVVAIILYYLVERPLQKLIRTS
jgi:peptidoglycan/LPS O-acetylase OafA/YrhL